MISQVVIDRINRQIQHELSNAYIYQGISLYFAGLNLNGFAAWFAKQSDEEKLHGAKLIDHLIDRGAKPELGALGAVRTSFESPLAVLEFVVKLEESTTGLIHELYEFAHEQKDYALEVLTQWYIAEQVEEEKWTNELKSAYEKLGACPGPLRSLDKHWGKKASGEES